MSENGKPEEHAQTRENLLRINDELLRRLLHGKRYRTKRPPRRLTKPRQSPQP